MRKAALYAALVLLLVLSAAPALADGVPKLPHAFYGSVTVNGDSAADGTQISATVDTGQIISTQNPVTTVGGTYGVTSPYLLVQGYDIPDGATITFHVTIPNGAATSGTAIFTASGGPTRQDLAVTIQIPQYWVPGGGGGGGGGGGVPTITTNLFGTQNTFRTDDQGLLLDPITATSQDGNMTITIHTGTTCLDKDGNRLTSLTAESVSPPAPPTDTSIIGLAYDLRPDGATFAPPLIITFNYDPDNLPEGVAEGNLRVAYYDEATGTWVELVCTVDTVNNIITASVSHFSIFAVIGRPRPAVFTLSALKILPAEVAPGEAVDISVSVANTGGSRGSYMVTLNINGTREAEKSVTVAAFSSQTVSFSVTRAPAGTYNVTIGGMSGSFTVLAPAEPAPAPAPTTPAPAPTTPTPEPPAPAPTPPAPAPSPTPTPTVGPNWPLFGGIVGGGLIIIILFITLGRRKA